MILRIRSLLIFFYVFAVGFVCLAADSYFPNIKSSIHEKWRWIELEALADIEYEYAKEDSEGKIWFSDIYGNIICYDGLTVESYPLHVGEYILDLLINQDENLVVLTTNEVYVLENSVWRGFNLKNKIDSPFYKMSEASDGSLWIVAKQCFIKIAEREIQTFKTEYFVINSILIDQRDRLWIADRNKNEVLIFDNLNSLSEVVAPHKVFILDHSNSFFSLHMGTDGRIWVTSPDQTGQSYYFKNDELRKGPKGLTGAFQDAQALETVKAFKMAGFDDGRCWFLVPRGLAEYDGERIQLFENSNFLPSTNSCILSLSNERLLIGGISDKTFILDLSNDRWTRFSGLNFQCKDQHGVDWFLEHDGRIVSHDTKSDNWTAYGAVDGLVDAPNNIFCSSDGTLWVSGKHQGIASVAYLKNEKWILLSFPQLGWIISHLGVCETHDGHVLFGSGTPSMWLKDVEGGVASFKKNHSGFWESSVNKRLNFSSRSAIIIERKPGEFWVGGELPLRSSDAANELKTRSSVLGESGWTDDMIVDKNNEIWIASWGKGLLRFNNEEWIHYTENEGLKNNQVICLMEGSHHPGIWLATSEGIDRFDGHNWTDWYDPFDVPYIRESVTLREDSDGALWINHAYRSWLLEGIKDQSMNHRFETFRYQKNRNKPDTEIHKFHPEIQEGDPIHLRWTGIDSWSETCISDLEFSWRIDNGIWSNFSKQNSVILDSIKSGSHLFEVRSRNRNWNIDTSPAQIRFSVIPPVWRRMWFVTLVMTIISLFAFLLQRLYQSRIRAAIAMEEFKLDFFTNISHELRNPLAVILGPLESLLKEEKSERKRKKLQLSLRNAIKMQTLVDQLLEFRKVEFGQIQYQPTDGEIIRFMHQIVELQSPLWKEKNMNVEIHSNRKQFHCSFDADKLQKIVDNLLSNAIKYSDPGGEIKVEIKIESNDDSASLNLSVQDHGIGIPPHELELISKTFYRVRETSGFCEGFGIGLALVSGLIEACRGKIKFISPVPSSNCGTRVDVMLPLQKDSLIRDDESCSHSSEDSQYSEILSKILVVEDNKDLRKFMKDELRKKHVIIEAVDGIDGFELALKHEPELIITDVMMPRMDGFQLCRKLRECSETSHITIMMLTAKSSVEHHICGIDSGADIFFPKPFHLEQLTVQIDRILEGRRKMKMRFSEQLIFEPKELTIVPADQKLVRKALDIVESNMFDHEFGIDQFSKKMGMGRSAFFKKLKALTGETPGSLIRIMRLKRAAYLLESENISISEILDYIGIDDHSYFSRSFKKEFGVSPSQYAQGKRKPNVDYVA